VHMLFMCSVRKLGSCESVLKRELNLDVTVYTCVWAFPGEGVDSDQGRTGVQDGYVPVHQRTVVTVWNFIVTFGKSIN